MVSMPDWFVCSLVVSVAFTCSVDSRTLAWLECIGVVVVVTIVEFKVEVVGCSVTLVFQQSGSIHTV